MSSTALLDLIDIVRGVDVEPFDPAVDGHVCHRCGDTYSLSDPTYSLTPLCNSCAHVVVEQYTRLLESAPDDLLVEVALAIHARDQREDDRSAAT